MGRLLAIDYGEKRLGLAISDPNQIISNRMFSDFKNLLNQRALGKPIAYLVGKKEFWKYEFIINE